MSVEAKICGLSTVAAVETAVRFGARFVGFVFFPPSPRNVAPEAARRLAESVPAPVNKVGLVVDADDRTLDPVVNVAGVDMLQLHGRESPERVAKVRERFGLPVMKAVAIGTADDLAAARDYEEVVDYLLFDARPPKDATRPGGNALAFDWSLLAGEKWAVPWFLAGGLHAGNLAEAVKATGARLVDTSSGVEDAPGVKNLDKIEAFLKAARQL